MKEFFIIISLIFCGNLVLAAEMSGNVLAVSSIPDPRTAPYEDCNYMVQLVQDNGDRINVILPAFRKRQLSPSGKLKKGDRIDFFGILFLDASSADHEVQLMENR